MEERTAIQPSPMFLDAETAKTAIRRGKNLNYIDDFMATAIPNLGKDAKSVPQTEAPPTQFAPKPSKGPNPLEGFQPGPERDFTWMDKYQQAQAPVETAKPKEEGFFTGLGKALSGGVQDTGASLYLSLIHI
jgi:hypothetical protein